MYILNILNNLKIINSNITNNTAILQGGAIFFENIKKFTIINSIFDKNSIQE